MHGDDVSNSILLSLEDATALCKNCSITPIKGDRRWLMDWKGIADAIAGMSPSALGALVLVSGFGLAAYAIYAVLSSTKGRH
jgi:hypothetical protein